MKSLLEEMDQNLIKEYGLTISYDHIINHLPAIEQEMRFGREPSILLKLLIELDNQDEAALKVIHNYLELRLGLGIDSLKKVD